MPKPVHSSEVIRCALSLGYRWVYVGGERPVLSNEHPPDAPRPLVHASTPPASRLLIVPCTTCGQPCTVHGPALGGLMTTGAAYCADPCRRVSRNHRQMTRRQEGVS